MAAPRRAVGLRQADGMPRRPQCKRSVMRQQKGSASNGAGPPTVTQNETMTSADAPQRQPYPKLRGATRVPSHHNSDGHSILRRAQASYRIRDGFGVWDCTPGRLPAAGGTGAQFSLARRC